MTFTSETKGASPTVSYALIAALVLATAGGGMYVLNGMDNPLSESQIEAQQFVVDREATAGGYEYALVYVGSQDLSDENTDVLEVSNDGGQILMEPDDWDGNTLSRGDEAVSDLSTEFASGEEVNIIKYTDAQIDGGSVVSNGESERLQRVTIRESDPEELDGNLSDILVDGDGGGSNTTVVVE